MSLSEINLGSIPLSKMLDLAQEHALQSIRNRLARDQAHCLPIFRIDDLARNLVAITAHDRAHLQNCPSCSRLFERVCAERQSQVPRSWIESAGRSLVTSLEPLPLGPAGWSPMRTLPWAESSDQQLEIEWILDRDREQLTLEIRSQLATIADQLIGVQILSEESADGDGGLVRFAQLLPDAEPGWWTTRLRFPTRELIPMHGIGGGVQAAPVQWETLQAIDRADLMRSIRECAPDSPAFVAWQDWGFTIGTDPRLPISFRIELQGLIDSHE